MPPTLLLQNISLTFGTTPLLTNAGLAIAPGDRICLVGRNGSGKSTLLRIAAGLIAPDAGRRFAQPGATIRCLPQEPDFSQFATTFAYVEAGLVTDAATARHRARYLLEQLGLTGDEPPATLSGGEARRVALARVLAPQAARPHVRLRSAAVTQNSPGPNPLSNATCAGIAVSGHRARRRTDECPRATIIDHQAWAG